MVGHVHRSHICKWNIFTKKKIVVFLWLIRAVINELTHKANERVALNSFRYAWTVVSNIFIYAVASALLGAHQGGDRNDITPDDAYVFRTLTLIVVGVGLVCMIIFHVGIKESDIPAEETEQRLSLSLTASGRLKRMTWKSFLREKQFYQCAFIWMFTRVIVNVTQVQYSSNIPFNSSN